MKTSFLLKKSLLVLPILAALALSACGEEEESKQTSNATQQSQSVQKAEIKDNGTIDLSTKVAGYEERVIGDPNAPVTIVEYASFTCPHCANFHTQTLPQIKKDYVDTGKVKFIFRDFPFEQVGATAALLSRCVDPSRYYGFSDLIMRQQANWTAQVNPIAGLTKMAKLAGMSDAMIEECMNNEKLLDQIVAVRKEAMDKYGFNSTPSFLVNNEKVVGAESFETFKKLIEAELN